MRRINIRPHIAELKQRPKSVAASYDAARNETGSERHWQNSDIYDADSANRLEVRQRLRSRSRYEIYNNGYADGIAQTYATDVIGAGPMLRMHTRSKPLNQLIEDVWYDWTRAVQLRRKLWCMAHAKHSDGEAFAHIVRNPRVRHRVKLDIMLIECDQVSTPAHLPWQEGHIDGVQFDRFGNPTFYELLDVHPGNTHTPMWSYEPRVIPANLMAHWFKLRRPGQHRGIPDCTSTLNCGASSRRWREATIAAAETAANLSMLLKTAMQPDEALPLEPLSTIDIEKNMMTALPEGWDALQMKAEHPNSSYEAFMRSHISEMARPKSMPYNKAAADSSSYNYASGRLDHQTYYASLDTDRADCDDMVLSVIFREWFWWAMQELNWLGGNPAELPNYDMLVDMHDWHWPSHQVADRQAEANADDKELKNGSQTLTGLWHKRGYDFEQEILPQLAADYGVDIDTMRQLLMASNLNANHQAQAVLEPTEPTGQEGDDDEA